MRPPKSKILQTFAIFTGGAALVLSSAGMAGAADHRADRDTSRTTVTEDTDANDNTANNIADDGDNAHPSGNDRSVENGGSGNQGNAQSDPDDDDRGPDNSNGGADTPDGPGGTDKADQDRNNGCGNDDDFEDDNEGRCLGRDGAPGQQGEFCPESTTAITDDTDANNNGTADVCESTNGGDEFCPESTTVITVDTDANNNGTADVCEPEVAGEVITNPVTPTVPGATPATPATPGVARATPAQPAVLDATATPNAQVLGAQVTRAPGQLARTGDGTTNLIPFGLGLVLLGFGIQHSSKRLSAARVR